MKKILKVAKNFLLTVILLIIILVISYLITEPMYMPYAVLTPRAYATLPKSILKIKSIKGYEDNILNGREIVFKFEDNEGRINLITKEKNEIKNKLALEIKNEKEKKTHNDYTKQNQVKENTQTLSEEASHHNNNNDLKQENTTIKTEYDTEQEGIALKTTEQTSAITEIEQDNFIEETDLINTSERKNSIVPKFDTIEVDLVFSQDGEPEIQFTQQVHKEKNECAHIVNLDEFLAIARNTNFIILNVKNRKNCKKHSLVKIEKTIRKYNLEQFAIIKSVDPIFLHYIRNTSVDIIVMYDFFIQNKTNKLQKNKYSWIYSVPFIQKQFRRVIRPDLISLSCKTDVKQIKQFKKYGYPIICDLDYTDNETRDNLTSLFDIDLQGFSSTHSSSLLLSDSSITHVHDSGNESVHCNVRYIKQQNDVVEAINSAKKQNKKISICGMKHSMGGQSLLEDTIQLNMLGLNHINYSEDTKIVTVGAGANWRSVQKVLQQYNRSVKTMQASNIFSIGGSISANVHGWQVGADPIASTIVSITIVNAEGEIQKITPENNKQLFSLILGGYGQFGVIIEAEIITVPNKPLVLKTAFVKPEELYLFYKKNIANNQNVELTYARVPIDNKNMFNEIGVFWYETDSSNTTYEMKEDSLVGFKRFVFRLSEKLDLGKKLRWLIEKKYVSNLSKSAISRNTVMNANIHYIWPVYQNNIDILHEYFVPKDKVSLFLPEMKRIVNKYNMNLLNVTIRDVCKDNIAFLPYATQDMFALVCCFSQKVHSLPEKKIMSNFTKDLIDIVLKLEGTFYLPYKLNYDVDHLTRSYPNIEEWVKMKKHYDPYNLFSSMFYENINRLLENNNKENN